MDFREYYEKNETFITELDPRLREIVRQVASIDPRRVLDIGCGNGLLLLELSAKISADLSGVDAFERVVGNFSYFQADLTIGIPCEDESFDCVALGEVIEHVPNPDLLLLELYRVLERGGTLILTTPNLASWANRILLFLGIQPLYTETSTIKKMGRVFKFLGQGAAVQGHLKIFTLRSLKEILISQSFIINEERGLPFFFPFPISILDKLFCRYVAASSNLLIVASKL